MSRWRPDQIDLWCEEWARERRKVLGLKLNERLMPFERIGRLNCTLGRVKEEAEGASHSGVRVGENGHVQRHWPEVYRGMAMEVHRAFAMMRAEWRTVMELHYCFKNEKISTKAAFLQLTDNEYKKQLINLKLFLSGHFGLDVGIAPGRKRFGAAQSAQKFAEEGLIAKA